MAGNKDLDWLYERDQEPTEPTKVFTPAELAQLDPTARRTETGSTRPQPARPGPTQGRAPARPTPPPPPTPPAQPPGRTDSPPPSSAAPRKRRRPLRTVRRLLTLVILTALAYLIAVPIHAWSNTAHVADQPAGERIANQPGETYLLVGSDSRENLTQEEKRRLGTGSTDGQRTDTIMILFRPIIGKPALISIPRDSYVSIPGHGRNKINAAFAIGGAPLLTQTVEQATGLRIDHYLEIGFGGFVDIIDALDGIDMCIPQDISDKNSHLELRKGCQTLDGVTALGYVRMRYADPEGDLGRVKRQRAMIAAVAAKAASPATVVNPVRYWRLNHAVAGALGLGATTSVTDLPFIALAMRDLSKPEALTLTVPIAGNISTQAGASLAWDEAKAAALFRIISTGTTAGLEPYVQK